MDTSYYELLDDLEREDRWHLSGVFDNLGRHLDSRQFTYGKVLDLGPPLKAHGWNAEEILDVYPPLEVRVYTRITGLPLDFTFDTSDAPVVTSRVADILATFGGSDVQRIPVKVESCERDSYELINICTRLSCVDRALSDVTWWSDVMRPDKAGMIKEARRLILALDEVHGHHIFRIHEWDFAIIVSEEIMRAFHQAKVTGVKYHKVST